MISPRCFLLPLLGIVALQRTGDANFLEANDEQNCMELCKNCDGEAIYQDNICQCHVADDDQRGAECIGRIKRQAGELGLDVISCDFADPDVDRDARCIVTPFRRFRSRNDVDLIAKYFMGNGFDGLGPFLGSKDETTSAASENVEAKTVGGENKLESDPGEVVGAPSPLGSIPDGQFVNLNPLLGAAAAWLHPQNLLGHGNGFGAQPYQNPTLGSTNYNHETNPTPSNFVGSAHQDTGDSLYAGTQNPYNPYAGGPVVGLPPYSYFLGSPSPVQLNDGYQASPLQPYFYSYDSMDGIQNPVLVGSSPFWYPTSPLEGGAPQILNSVNEQEQSLGESGKADEELTGEPDPDLALAAKKTTEFEDKTDGLEKDTAKIQEPVVSSKQTANNSENQSEKLQETKRQVPRFTTHGARERPMKFRSKAKN